MGTKGWHSRGYLPHYDGWGITQHIIFRLVDSLPREAVPDDFDALLDMGSGKAILADPICAEIVEQALLYFDGDRYRVQGWCVMPSHVHVLVATQLKHSIGIVVGGWKSFSARRINAHLGARGSVWAPDYFDRYIRDQQHFETTLRYIETNPVQAGLVGNPADWRFSSARRSGRWL